MDWALAGIGARSGWGWGWVRGGGRRGGVARATAWGGVGRARALMRWIQLNQPNHNGGEMDRGQDFLKSQVNNAVMQHQTFLKALEDHEGQADDQRFRDLCAQYIPMARQQQQNLENYQEELGAEAGVGKKAVGAVLGWTRDLADATRESDFLRLVGDIVMGRQAEDTFKTFRDAGRQLGMTRLAEVGDAGERQMDQYVKDANRLVEQMFVDYVRDTEPKDAHASRSSSRSESSAR